MSLAVADTLYAGDAPRVPVTPGRAVRVMTGAMLPPGCDCVLKQEDTDMGSPVVELYASLRPGDNYVHRGEDYRAGTCLLPAGSRVDAAAVGVLSSAGITEVPVRRRPRVGVLSTGDEVVEPGVRPLPVGKIYGANLPLLLARLRELGIENVTGQLAGDDPQAVAEAMARMLETCDLLITTGGVSVGDKDIFHQALPLLGAERVFWRLKLKPAPRPCSPGSGASPSCPCRAIPSPPSPPSSCWPGPLLAALSGEPELLPRREKAVLDTPFPKGSGIRRFVRGKCGNGHVSLPEGHSSGVLRSLVGCSCLVDIPAGSGPLAAGQTVDILML